MLLTYSIFFSIFFTSQQRTKSITKQNLSKKNHNYYHDNNIIINIVTE